MRCLFATFVFVLVAGSTPSQTLSPDQVIQRIIDRGVSEGQDQKIIGGMGDAAAVIVTKVLAGRSLGTTNIDNILVVLNSSFADPRLVDSASDREPRTALFVLRCLDSSTTDTQLKQRIAETRNRIMDRFTKYVRSGTVQ
jgi:hypothetical protein